MTFGTLQGWQAWTLVLTAATIALVLFNLKVRPPRQRVPSLLIWRRILAEPRALTWWERLRRAVSRVVTVAVAMVLVGSALEPRPDGVAQPWRTRIVLDSAWSMAAALPDGGTRWDRATVLAASLARTAPGEIVLATTADGVVEGPTRDAETIERAFAGLRTSGGADAPWTGMEEGEVVHFVTDGAVPRALPPSVTVHTVHAPAPNVAITAFEAQPAISSAAGAEAYVEVANFAAETQAVHLTITRDAATVTDRWIELVAGEVRSEVISLAPGGGPRLRAHITAAGNSLALDDDAVAWVADADAIEVLLVSDSPEALASVFARDPRLRLRVVAPVGYAAAPTADVVVFDRWVPAEAPGKPSLVVAPAGGASWLGGPGPIESEPRWRFRRPHPVLAGVEPELLGATRGGGSTATDLALLAASETGTPLIAIDDQPLRRLVLLAFEGDESVRRAPAFPVLVGNAISWLGRPDVGGSARPGPVAFPRSTTAVAAPDGEAVPLVRTASAVVGTLAHPGLYLATVGGARAVVAVNASDRQMSNLMQTSVVAADDAVPDRPLAGRPWWVLGVLAAFTMLTAEWWTWQRRITV